MSQQNGGQIQVRRGQFGETTTTSNDLIANQATKPAIRNMLQSTQERYLMTLLTSGGAKKGMGGVPYLDATQRTRSGKLDPAKEDKGIGNNAYRFDVIGKIERAAVIIRQQGASGSDGTFTLLMRDTTLYPGHVVKFSSGYMARVQSFQQGSSAAGYVYQFKSVNGTNFVYSTHVGTVLSCFPMFSSYSEGSLRSDSRDKKPDTFINHMTIQRKTCAMTGGAQSDVLIYEYADTNEMVGWLYWKLEQARKVMANEKERWAWFGVSSMKNSDGSYRAESSLGVDPETNLPIICGDGFEEQIAGTNTIIGSGTNGELTSDNFSDILTTIVKNSNVVAGVTLVAVTGTDGIANAAIQCQALTATQNIQMVQIVSQTSEPGGADVDAGFNYQSFNINGNKILFITHPMLDNEDIFPARGNDGRLLSSSTYYFVGVSSDKEKPTMEILHKEANGIKRDFVEAKIIGLTGMGGIVSSEGDYNKFAMLSESMFNVYAANLCAIGYKAS